MDFTVVTDVLSFFSSTNFHVFFSSALIVFITFPLSKKHLMDKLFWGDWIRNILFVHIPFIALLISPFLQTTCQATSRMGAVFSKKNLVAWCIVPFDNKKKGGRRAGSNARQIRDFKICLRLAG